MDRNKTPPDCGQAESNVGHDSASFEELIKNSPEFLERVEAYEQQIADLIKSRQNVEIQLPSAENEIRFAVISDTHFGSSYERLDCLRDFAANAKHRGINLVLHAGDVLTGHDVYRGHRYEVHKHGWKQQRDHFIDVAPKGFDYQFITGNHDHSFKKQNGIDVGNELMNYRDDWHFIGEDIGRVDLKNSAGQTFKVLLLHPDGGTPYAISYRMQKVIEQLPGGQKPHMYIQGHLHKMCILPSYRNVLGVDAGCFEDQTPFMARKASAAHVGGYFFVVRFRGEKALSMQVGTEWITYY